MTRDSRSAYKLALAAENASRRPRQYSQKNPRRSSAGDFRFEAPELRQRYWVMCESGSNATSLPPTAPTMVFRLPTTTPPFGAASVAGSEPTPALTVMALAELLLLYSVTSPSPRQTPCRRSD